MFYQIIGLFIFDMIYLNLWVGARNKNLGKNIKILQKTNTNGKSIKIRPPIATGEEPEGGRGGGRSGRGESMG